MGKKETIRKHQLEGVCGYTAHLSSELQAGKLKTIQEVMQKVCLDGSIASGALSLVLIEEIKIAGCACALLETKKED